MKTTHTSITVAHGDGIGPEIMKATLRLLEAAGANLKIDNIEVGQRIYEQGISSGIKNTDWEILRKNKILLKAPITTPQGKGVKSLNVTLRKTLGLYANVRPCIAYAPYIKTLHPEMDIVIIRENEEDLYGAIEYRQTPEAYECTKLITEPGSERIIRYAFEYARLNKRKKVSCFSKDNIMKMTDGLFHRTFDRLAKEYPDIKTDHYIIDIGTARLATQPRSFDVIVTENLYGDIISDVAAELTGSVGLAGSSNLGEQFALFEAIHGSAPDIAGKDIANPSGLILASIMMLVHLGKSETAATLHNAWLKTLEEGFHTADIYSAELSRAQLGTQAFANKVIENLGRTPEHFKKITYSSTAQVELRSYQRKRPPDREIVGYDIYIYHPEISPKDLADLLKKAETNDLKLSFISNRGTQVWPHGKQETFCIDYWRCRFEKQNTLLKQEAVLMLIQNLIAYHHAIIRINTLHNYDQETGFSLAQGG